MIDARGRGWAEVLADDLGDGEVPYRGGWPYNGFHSVGRSMLPIVRQVAIIHWKVWRGLALRVRFPNDRRFGSAGVGGDGRGFCHLYLGWLASES